MYAVGAIDARSRDTESTKYREYMNTDLNQSQPPISAAAESGGGEYRSNPTSFLATLLDGGGGGGFAELLNSGGSGVYDVKEEMVVQELVEREYCGYEEGEGGDDDDVGSNQVQLQSSSGFFSNLTAVENGFAVMSDVEKFRDGNGINGESSPARRLNNHIHFSSGQSSSSIYTTEITKNGNKISNPENRNNGFYVPSFENNNWNGSNFRGLKRSREDEDKFSGFNDMDYQNGNDTSCPSRLTHHLSLPKTSSEMAAMEKYLQFQQEVVPCKIRAKRGFATHPRSIAERMRRTRISDRMKKLQDLFPDMDKQTNTADMLDLAVDYIKNLQNQVEELTVKQANCTCSK